ncbi:MAG: class I SAM-dependent methyltransferase [Candidatus Adiutricales bacterium]
MTLIFDSRSLKQQEAWLKTEAGRAAFELQKNLVLGLVSPKARERLLDVGCGSGLYLQIFRREGLYVTGLDPSVAMLDQARKQLGPGADLFPGEAEELPFEDNEFDIVILIMVLERAVNPGAVLAEAFRVARSRVFIGALNGLSMTALALRTKGLIKPDFYNRIRYITPWGVMNMMSELTDTSQIRWRTVHLLPPSLSHRVAVFESRPLVQSNPFGAFLGMAAKKTHSVRTDNLTVKSEVKFKRQPAPTPTTYSTNGHFSSLPRKFSKISNDAARQIS